MPAQVSVIIVSYNVSEMLRACLLSVFEQQVPVEVIVVDNASTDDSVSMVQNQFPQVKLIANTANAGFSAANNQGMESSSGDYIFLLNPDTELKPGAIQSLLDYAVHAGKPVLAGPRMLNSDGSLQVSAWKKPGPADMIAEAFFLHRILGVSAYPESQFSNEFEAGMLSGAALFFPKTLFEKIGGLDPHLFWMEDADFSRRAKLSGADVRYLPAAVVVHHSGQSSKKNQKIVVSNQLISKLKYYRKHLSWLAFASGVFFCFIHICTRILIFTGLSVLSSAYRNKAAAYYFTFGKFFRYLFTSDKSVT